MTLKNRNDKLFRKNRHRSLKTEQTCRRRVLKLVFSKSDCSYNIRAIKHQFTCRIRGEHIFGGWILDINLFNSVAAKGFEKIYLDKFD